VSCQRIPEPIAVIKSDPCNPSPCKFQFYLLDYTQLLDLFNTLISIVGGPFSECKEINGVAACSCQTGYIGAPPSCRPECVVRNIEIKNSHEAMDTSK